MVSAGRAVAGVAVIVVAALVAFLALRGHAGDHPAGARGGAATAPGGAAMASPPHAGPHQDPFTGPAGTYVAGRSGTVLAAIYDVTTGQSWQLGNGQAQDEASVVKLNILEALLAQHGGDGLGSGDRTLARSMIEDSDNDAATSLWEKAGGAAGLTSYNGLAGLAGTSPSPCVTCAGFPWPGWGLTTSVPSDQLTLLKQIIAPGSHPLLSPSARAYALSLLENVTPDQRWGVSGGVPAGVTVALKNGWLPLNDANTDWQVNSVGWISGDGRDYLIAVLSTGNPTEQYGIDTISGLSARVWSAMR